MGRWALNILGGLALTVVVLIAAFSKPIQLRGEARDLFKVREL